MRVSMETKSFGELRIGDRFISTSNQSAEGTILWTKKEVQKSEDTGKKINATSVLFEELFTDDYRVIKIRS